MKVLIIASGNSGKVAPFILDQAEALKDKGVVIDYYLIKGSGIKGYFKNYSPLLKKIKQFKPDILHAHYGLSGLLSSLQRLVPTIVTFHGSDINVKKNRPFSKMAYFLSKDSVFVSENLAKLLNVKDSNIIPCGVDFRTFKLIDKKEASKLFNLNPNKKYVLFSSSFNNKVKNYPLAKAALEKLENVELLELKGYNREQVGQLMNAVDAVIMTSFSEGSPQFIKEALACNCPIVSVNVGDVSELLSNTDAGFLVTYDAQTISDAVKKAIKHGRTKSRDKVKDFDNEIIANRLINLYNKILNE